eukprot:COSAG04_NODE_19953_length_404_cov_1.006557_2_plen_30_part_01
MTWAPTQGPTITASPRYEVMSAMKSLSFGP